MENIALVTIKIPSYQSASSASRPAGSTSSNSSKRSQDSGQAKKMLAMPPVPVSPSNSTMTRSDKAPEGPSLGVKFISAGTAACIADMATFPLDTAKVRLQIQGENLVSGAVATAGCTSAARSVPKPKGLLGTVAQITRTEGLKALYSGLSPGLQRQMCFASVRIGLYDSVKHKYSKMLKLDPSQQNIGLRILAGITTGGAAVLVAQPTDVVKVRMQAQGKNKRYASSIAAYRKIAMEEGARGLWKGVVPNVSRNAIVNCTELVSYDLIKEAIIHRGLLSDNIPCHFLSAVGAGFFTTLFASPVDVLKTRYMNSPDGAYKGVFDCAQKMAKEGGLRTFYKGAVPAFLRFGPWNVVMFVSFEQLKKLFSSIGQNQVSQPVNKDYQSLELKSKSSRFM